MSEIEVQTQTVVLIQLYLRYLLLIAWTSLALRYFGKYDTLLLKLLL